MEVINNKYHNGKIYTIRSYQTDKYYIGSTCQPLHKRLSQHRLNYKTYLNGMYHKVSSFEMIKYDDNYIELLENYKCENKEQLNRYEGELIRKFKDSCVNRCIAGRTLKEYYEDNKDKVQQQNKEYYHNNKESIQSKQKMYYQLNKDAIKAVVQTYLTNHKTEIKAQRKKYDEKNKVKQSVQRNQVIHCECGKTYTRQHKARHFENKKHLNEITNIQNTK